MASSDDDEIFEGLIKQLGKVGNDLDEESTPLFILQLRDNSELLEKKDNEGRNLLQHMVYHNRANALRVFQEHILKNKKIIDQKDELGFAIGDYIALWKKQGWKMLPATDEILNLFSVRDKLQAVENKLNKDQNSVDLSRPASLSESRAPLSFSKGAAQFNYTPTIEEQSYANKRAILEESDEPRALTPEHKKEIRDKLLKMDYEAVAEYEPKTFFALRTNTRVAEKALIRQLSLLQDQRNDQPLDEMTRLEIQKIVITAIHQDLSQEYNLRTSTLFPIVENLRESIRKKQALLLSENKTLEPNQQQVKAYIESLTNDGKLKDALYKGVPPAAREEMSRLLNTALKLAEEPLRPDRNSNRLS